MTDSDDLQRAQNAASELLSAIAQERAAREQVAKAQEFLAAMAEKRATLRKAFLEAVPVGRNLPMRTIAVPNQEGVFLVVTWTSGRDRHAEDIVTLMISRFTGSEIV